MDRHVVGGELAQMLAAAAARRDQRFAFAHHHRLDDAPLAVRHHHGDRRDLGAGALRIGRILHIAARIELAVARRAAPRRRGKRE